MADVKKIATRDSYGAALVELGQEHEDIIVFDADLAGATKTGVFKKAFPDRHFNCGIAEGNMMAVAAGAAAMGLVPFASSFAMFASGRAFEQGAQLHRLPPPEREDLRQPRRAVGGGGRGPPTSAARTSPSCGPSPAWWSCAPPTTWRPGPW